MCVDGGSFFRVQCVSMEGLSSDMRDGRWRVCLLICVLAVGGGCSVIYVYVVLWSEFPVPPPTRTTHRWRVFLLMCVLPGLVGS